jgi:hypothetical protein
MRTKVTRLAGVIVVVVLGLAFAGAPLAQTTTAVDVRNFEVISVDGNKLVVRDQKGTQQYTVPDDFRFTVDGKKVSVAELKPGMKGTATVTTTTKITPVVVTDVRNAEVLAVDASKESVIVRGADGAAREFTQGQLDAKGVKIIMDGAPTQVANLHRGDKLTATIITEGPPIVRTEQEVQVTLAQSKAEPAPATATAAAPAAQAPAPAAQTAAAPAQTPAPAVSPPPSAAQPAPPAAEPSGLGSMWYVLIAALVAVVLFLVMRRRKGA